MKYSPGIFQGGIREESLQLEVEKRASQDHLPLKDSRITL